MNLQCKAFSGIWRVPHRIMSIMSGDATGINESNNTASISEGSSNSAEVCWNLKPACSLVLCIRIITSCFSILSLCLYPSIYLSFPTAIQIKKLDSQPTSKVISLVTSESGYKEESNDSHLNRLQFLRNELNYISETDWMYDSLEKKQQQ